jgi:hypothetical protein
MTTWRVDASSMRSAPKEVHDQGDDGKEQEHVNQKAGYVVDEKAPGPEQKQNHEQSQKGA